MTGYAPLYEGVHFPQSQTNVGSDETQFSDALVMESLRRLARRYVDNPEALVNAVHLEPGRSRRFRVVVVLEVADIL
jgi:hypothetical protein